MVVYLEFFNRTLSIHLNTKPIEIETRCSVWNVYGIQVLEIQIASVLKNISWWKRVNVANVS